MAQVVFTTAKPSIIDRVMGALWHWNFKRLAAMRKADIMRAWEEERKHREIVVSHE